MPVDMKETIAQAAKTLLMEKGVKKLTVKDIVGECQITRQAFYYHFEESPGQWRGAAQVPVRHGAQRASICKKGHGQQLSG